MQIERAEFLPAQGDGRQSFYFKPDKLNLFSTEEDQKKTDLFTAISGVFWGNNDADLASAEKLKEGIVELDVQGKKVSLLRDFESDALELKADDELKISSISE